MWGVVDFEGVFRVFFILGKFKVDFFSLYLMDKRQLVHD